MAAIAADAKRRSSRVEQRGKTRPDMGVEASHVTGPRIEFTRRPPERLPDDVLAAFSYGSQAAGDGDPRVLHAGLSAADGQPAMELWRAPGRAKQGTDGPVRFCSHPAYLFGILDFDEGRFAGIADAAESCYRQIREFQSRQSQPHLLRVWNFLDSINGGDGDLERYRQFCVGRARGLGDLPSDRLPAATAVGRARPVGRMQVCWLAGREPGRPIENPRQERAYRYPREYGPSPPAFARAIRLETGELIGSGTSSIVGHQSKHDGDLAAQVEETLANLRELYRAGGGSGTVAGIKVYLREPVAMAGIAEAVRAGLAGREPPLLIKADICRRELLVEIECLWT
jgi:chorismate lyase/3-hydroxybenzoate synthase